MSKQVNNSKEETYEGGLIDGLMATVAALVPEAPAPASALTVDEVLARIAAAKGGR